VILTGITSWSVHSEQRLPDSSTRQLPAAVRPTDALHNHPGCLGQRFDQRPDPLASPGRRTIDHHGEIGPAVDGEGRVLPRSRPGDGVAAGACLPSP